MADDKNSEKIHKNTGETLDESGLKNTIDSVSLDGIDSLMPEIETLNTKQNKDQTTTSLSGIDDITSYIQKQKQKNERTSPDLLTARDGTDLRSQEGVYAVVPHKKNDHKLVYDRKNAPKDLIQDPKERKKGTEYKKNGMKIYDVHVDYAQHPTLKSADGQPLDVWIIDNPKDLDDQLQAIRNGKGGGTNFMSPVINEQISETDPISPKKSKRKLATKKIENTNESKDTEGVKDEEKEISGNKKELSLDDILPTTPQKENKEESKVKSKESTTTESPNKEKTLDDILPTNTKNQESKIESIDKTKKQHTDLKALDDILPTIQPVVFQDKEVNNKEQQSNKGPQKELSLDDILPTIPTTQKEESKENESQENKENNADNKKNPSLNDILPPEADTTKELDEKKQDDSEEISSSGKISVDEAVHSSQEDKTTQQKNEQEQTQQEPLKIKDNKSPTSKTPDQSDLNYNTKIIDADEDNSQHQEDPNVEQEKEVDKSPSDQANENTQDSLPDLDLSSILPRNEDLMKLKKEESNESEGIGDLESQEDKVSIDTKDSIDESDSELELPEIQLPDLDSFIPKNLINVPDPILPDPEIKNNYINTSGAKDTSIKKENTTQENKTTEQSNDFSASDIIDTQEEEIQNAKSITPPTPQTSAEEVHSKSFSLSESTEPMASEIAPESEPTHNTETQESDDLIDLDDMTFEPIVQDELVKTNSTVYNDGIIGNEDQASDTTNNKGKLIVLIIKSFIALVLLGLAARIVIIMVGGSNKSMVAPSSDTPAIQIEEPSPQQEQPQDIPPIQEPTPVPVQPTPTPEPQPQPQPQPIEPEEDIEPEEIVEQYTIPELIAKIQAQQTEARKVLNKAKLLNDREGIKFATAALLKSSKLLDEAKDDPTITADQLQRDAMRIDLYLGQAQSIVEG